MTYFPIVAESSLSTTAAIYVTPTAYPIACHAAGGSGYNYTSARVVWVEVPGVYQVRVFTTTTGGASHRLELVNRNAAVSGSVLTHSGTSYMIGQPIEGGTFASTNNVACCVALFRITSDTQGFVVSNCGSSACTLKEGATAVAVEILKVGSV